MVFFFQAEDGIRDWSVTGVQTCALPIFRRGPDAMTDRTAWGLGFRAPISGLSTDVGRAELAGRDQPAEDVERLGDTRLERPFHDLRRDGGIGDLGRERKAAAPSADRGRR